MRRLAAILATDVAGYSRLMELDEEATHESFKAHFNDVIQPRIRERFGRIVKSTGDGVLAEFASVFEAVMCAIEIQSLMSHRNVAVEIPKRVEFRIGINMGDVIAEPDDIYGDGVNVAARLQGLAEPGGICVSENVHQQVHDRVPVAFEDLGHRAVKNITRELRVFGLRAEAVRALPIADTLLSYGTPLPIAEQRPGAFAPHLSIVVLPFANLSDEGAQQYLADALTDDVTTDLSRITDMIVISRNTADTYRGSRLSTPQIGRELNVRYVLKGSIRRLHDDIRVNTQLGDSTTDTVVWADRFQYSAVNLFRLQDDVTSRIAIALDLELVKAEAARPTRNPSALDFVLRGRAALDHPEGATQERFDTAINCFESALQLDPGSADVRARLALAVIARVVDQLSIYRDQDMERAHNLIEQALAIAPRHPVAHLAKGHLLRARGQYSAAITEYEIAVSFNRNWLVAVTALGLCKFFAGDIEETIPAQELAIRLSPRDPRVPNWYWRIGMVHLLQSRIDDAILWLEKARNANPTLPGPHAWLASAYALSGNMSGAVIELADAHRLSPDHRYLSIARFEATQSLGSPKTYELARSTFLAGLRMAGVPER